MSEFKKKQVTLSLNANYGKQELAQTALWDGKKHISILRALHAYTYCLNINTLYKVINRNIGPLAACIYTELIL